MWLWLWGIPVKMSHNILTNHVAAPTVTHVCNHKTHDLRFVFCSRTKHKSESLFLCFKYELQVRLVCNQHLLSWKHTAWLETLVYQKFLTIYGSFKATCITRPPFQTPKVHFSVSHLVKRPPVLDHIFWSLERSLKTGLTVYANIT